MAQNADDVLTVMWLARVAGLDGPEGLALDIAPLLETVPDLERAEEVLDGLFTDAFLAPHLARRDNRQLVMVGYSDSNKDGGIAAARWALHRALDAMARSATRHGVTLTVFHGRGGTVSRGGGLVHRAVAAMPRASIGGRLRLTEQGEVIDAKYGLPPIALRNLERMLGSIVLRSADPTDDRVPARWSQMADVIATTARARYRGLVYEHPHFKDYFRAGTPIDVIERMAIGSRPASRREGAGVQDLRAIPWVFSWTQCRAMLTGWFGLGSGLRAAKEAFGADLLREAAAAWPFLDTLLADVEMVLAKADLDIAALYAPLAPEASRVVFSEIQKEFDHTVAAILEIRSGAGLLDGEPTLQRSIRLRNPYVDPMNILQVDLLRRWREQDRPEGALLSALLATVNGIARGLQNTG
jgi:phosphoenolpyruvate carboxylase